MKEKSLLHTARKQYAGPRVGESHHRRIAFDTGVNKYEKIFFVHSGTIPAKHARLSRQHARGQTTHRSSCVTVSVRAIRLRSYVNARMIRVCVDLLFAITELRKAT